MGSLVLPSRYDNVVLELTPTAHPLDGAYAVVPTWSAKLTAAGIEATLVCPESEDAPQTLSEFFAELYEQRLGWEGERSWQSHGGAMHWTVTHDGINTVRADVALHGGGIEPRWQLVSQLYTDPGIFQQLSSNARLFGEASLAPSES